MGYEEIELLKIYKTYDKEALLRSLRGIEAEIAPELKEFFLNCLKFVESSSSEEIKAVLESEEDIL